MKKMKLTKIIASLLVVATMLTIYPIGASAEWKHDSNGWWNSEGSSWSVGWKQIDGKWYYFGQDGYMVHDATVDGYKIGSDGVWIETTEINPPQISNNYNINLDAYNKGWKHGANGWWNTEKSFITGWQLIENKYYFFDIDGTMERNKIIDGYYLDADGAWDSSKGKAKLQDITMKTEKSIYALGTKDINAYIVNNTNQEVEYGTMYEVDKFENNEWHPLAFADNTEFEMVGIVIPIQITGKENYKLSTLQDFKKLTAGKYRIVKEIDNSIGITHATAEFELQ
ncbi:hypothetical protein B0P06_004465 [Clostridium saccharoperbutylacetonicum]|uniref:Bacterial Ig-like domain-containing protein n=1 Tax=Clostridium saccharoperbutylacetonicum N1-4(HMT) TaxID=931276 RepID=M1N192_9CLOT|nr:immunoglobulin-like domain-containing protein [Clostridium saccharoperbutylacetonicum]AGF57242.1 hypothetical protein Cspa_c34810 [Clostridium saccharoperbutylacetonicum N1-4(HMT)]NRT61996.1 hypothetical protein [Clostridium saccharoperbutylacetonicum]NSB25325.1 hypothetical protein [Clostridium saccharoperbutylacetonicum]NSB44694.1 hypothetical protein [Clostridium saccharoperbutylacetonicum]